MDFSGIPFLCRPATPGLGRLADPQSGSPFELGTGDALRPRCSHGGLAHLPRALVGVEKEQNLSLNSCQTRPVLLEFSVPRAPNNLEPPDENRLSDSPFSSNCLIGPGLAFAHLRSERAHC